VTDRIRSSFPTDVDVPVRFMDRFTVRDVARLAVPAGLGLVLAGVHGVVAGVVVGCVLVAVSPIDQKLDVHAANYVKHQAERRTGSWPRAEAVDQDSVILDNGTVLGLVQVSSCDLDMLSEAEQSSNRSTVHDLFKTVDFPVEVHSRQRREDLSRYQAVADNAVVTDHYITVRVSKEEGSLLETGESETGSQGVDNVELVDERCTVVRNELTGGDLYAERLSGDEFRQALARLYSKGEVFESRRYEAVDEEGVKRRMLYVSGFPREVRLGWLADVLNVDGLVNTVQVVSPVTEKQRDWLSRMTGRLQAELSEARDPGNQTELQRAKEDAEDMLDAEIGGERLVNYGVYIVARGDTDTEVDQTLEAVKTTLRRHRIEFKEPLFHSYKAAKTESVFQPDALQKTLIVPGLSAAAAFPYATYDTIQDNGIVFGTDTRNNVPAVLDRFSWEAPHIARMGKTGSGKTYHSCLEIIRSVRNYDDLQVHIIDPKPDYAGIVEALDGAHVALDHETLGSPSADIIRYTVEDPTRDSTELLVDAVRHVYQQTSNDTGKSVVLIDEAHRLLRSPDGRTAVGELIREGRAKNIGVDLITQNASDFTRSQEGRDILKNVDCLFFLKHQDVDSSTYEFFNLSRSESVTLRKLRTGTDLPFSEAVVRGPVNTKLRIKSTPQEHSTIQQNGEEKVGVVRQ